METRTPHSTIPPRPPFWAASIAVHVTAAIALVVWGAGSGAEVEPLRPVEITAEVDYAGDESPPETEETEEPEAHPRPTASPFGEPAPPQDDFDDLEEERPDDYVLPRIPVPPLSWSREAVIRPLPERDPATPPVEVEASAEEPEPEPAEVAPTPSRRGVTASARPDANRSPAPRYPTRARRRNIEGRVVLIVEIDARGRPTGVSVSKSSGHAILDRAATEALWKWRFIPAMRDGVPVASTRHQSFRFQVE